MGLARVLADMCQAGTLAPDKEIQCRYHLTNRGVALDVLSPDGYNVPSSKWLRRAADKAAPFELGDGRTVHALTPPYFLATKLIAFADRGPDAVERKDAEDIVALAIEIPALRILVHAEGLKDEIAELWAGVFKKYRISAADIVDIVDSPLHQDDADERERAISTLTQLARGE